MRRLLVCLAVLFTLMVDFGPIAADARIGLGSSYGSRGSRTWSAPPATGTSPYGAAPMQRSTTVPGGGWSGGRQLQ